jgi:uncharacterized protein (DUF1800 family)
MTSQIIDKTQNTASEFSINETSEDVPSSLLGPSLTGMVATLALTACGGAPTDIPAASSLSTTVPVPASASAPAPVSASSPSSPTSPSSTSPSPSAQEPPTAPAVELTEMQASRFLAQASMGATRAEIASVKKQGLSTWIDAQMAMPQSMSRFDWLVSKGFDAPDNRFGNSGVFDSASWKKIISAPDTLRQRVTLALSEILVVAIDGLNAVGWKAFVAASHLDLLESNAFGNYRDLLGKVSTSAAMGEYLTFRGNLKYNPITGAMPDENYAREIMQLFSIGLVQLNLDGSLQLPDGKAVETYSLSDITGLARIFTGWDFNPQDEYKTSPNFARRPMVQIAGRHETGPSTFLNTTIPAGLDGQTSLNMTLDVLFAHQNIAPFISKQFIQKLVTSNPSPAYIKRIAAVFKNDGTGVKGNLAAVIRAILLDSEARDDGQVMSATNTTFGKQREPILRFAAWARAYGASTTTDTWSINDTSDPGKKLAQSPLRSPSVFNFFSPGYVPPNSAIANASLVAPEFGLTNETTVAGYINYMQNTVSNGQNDVKPDYTSLQAIADDAQSLINEINLVLAAGQITNPTLALIKNAIGSMPSGTATYRNNRIYAALTLVLAAPEFIVLK